MPVRTRSGSRRAPANRGADSGNVFVELFCEPGAELSGLIVEGINGSDGSLTISPPLAGTLPSDGLFVFADDAGDGTTFAPNADLVHGGAPEG